MTRMTRKDAISFIGIFVAVLAIASVIIAYKAMMATADVQSSNVINAILFVQATCFTTVNPNSIDFGSVSPATTSGTKTTTVSDGVGNADSWPWISGGSWSVGGAASPTFYVTNTMYENGLAIGGFQALTTTATNTYGLIKPTATAITNVLTLEVTVPAGQTTDTYNQIIIITDTC